jgi:hypothetical protein
VQGSVDRDVIQVEPDDPVERRERFGLERVEHPRPDPLVAATAQRRVGHLAIEDRLDCRSARS